MELSAFFKMSDALESLSRQISVADPTVGKGIAKVAQYFKREIAIIHYGKEVYIAGTDCSTDFNQAKTCWGQKNFSCVGQQIGKCIVAIQTNIPKSTWVNDLAKGLTETENTVVLV